MYGSAANGDPGKHDALIGVCVDTNVPGADGGYVEVGEDACYGVIDGSDFNDVSATGYVGYNTGCGVTERDALFGNKDWNCDGNDTGAGHNSGDCFWLGTGVAAIDGDNTNAVTTMLVCDLNASDWSQASRDGCSIP